MNIKRITIAAALLSLLVFYSFDAERETSFTDQRDGEQYEIIEIENLLWFRENLRYRPGSGRDTLIPDDGCGVFCKVEQVKSVCPEGWRLPREKEVKNLMRLEKKGEIIIKDLLNIKLCGRIDYEKHTKSGMQNTFWLDEDLEGGKITHWHTFSEEHKTHNHNVVNARRKFPVRCVCEI